MQHTAEIYQREIKRLLQGLDRVGNIPDDIIIGAEISKEMFMLLETTLQRLKGHNLTLNKSKCKFFQHKVVFQCQGT